MTIKNMKHGFIDFNGNAWSNAAVDAYNTFNNELRRATYKHDVDVLLDQRHRFFVMVLHGGEK